MKELLEFINEENQRNLASNNFINETFERPTVHYNPYNLVRVDEMNVKQMIERHSANGYIIISPCRDYADFIATGELDAKDIGTQKFRDQLNAINQKRIRKMIVQIKNSGYSYTPVYGGFVENLGKENEVTVYERSFIIYNYDKKGKERDFGNLYELGLDLCR